MSRLLGWVDRTPFILFLVAAFTLGLAPFAPEPHVWQKLKMLFAGALTRPMDIFDFFLHGIPWLALGLKLYATAIRSRFA